MTPPFNYLISAVVNFSIMFSFYPSTEESKTYFLSPFLESLSAPAIESLIEVSDLIFSIL